MLNDPHWGRYTFSTAYPFEVLVFNVNPLGNGHKQVPDFGDRLEAEGFAAISRWSSAVRVRSPIAS